MQLLNLTQHCATEEQVAQGVVEPSDADKKLICYLLTFTQIPEAADLKAAANGLAKLALQYKVEKAMVGGAPFFMRNLEDALYKVGIKPVYAFSERESMEVKQEDGSIKKVNIFRHKGFIERNLAD